MSLVTDMRGRPVAPRPVEIVSRTGLDLNPLDPTDPDDRLWLQALIWPEHHDRRQRLLGALELAARHPSRLVSGDALVTLGPLLEALPKGEPVVVINSFILNQLPAEMRTRIKELIDEQRVTRPIYRVSMEWLDTRDESSSLEVDLGSGMEKIGAAHPHGEWLELYARP